MRLIFDGASGVPEWPQTAGRTADRRPGFRRRLRQDYGDSVSMKTAARLLAFRRIDRLCEWLRAEDESPLVIVEGRVRTDSIAAYLELVADCAPNKEIPM